MTMFSLDGEEYCEFESACCLLISLCCLRFLLDVGAEF